MSDKENLDELFERYKAKSITESERDDMMYQHIKKQMERKLEEALRKEAQDGTL